MCDQKVTYTDGESFGGIKFEQQNELNFEYMEFATSSRYHTMMLSTQLNKQIYSYMMDPR